VTRIALGITLVLGFAGGLVVEWEATHSQVATSSSDETTRGP
jgi:hypothetical protein